jgi:RimJ/RimL family protein N-acetyltransferase
MTPSSPDPVPKIFLRFASSQDAAQVFALRLEALSLHPEAFSADYELTAAEGAGLWAQRLEAYAKGNTAAIAIACVDEQLVGMSGIGLGHWPKTRHTAILWGVYVRENWRGKHIAEQLINACLDWSAKNAVNVVRLGVNVSNMRAIRCYSRCGFTVYGVEPRSLFYQGEYYDELLMVKLL